MLSLPCEVLKLRTCVGRMELAGRTLVSGGLGPGFTELVKWRRRLNDGGGVSGFELTSFEGIKQIRALTGQAAQEIGDTSAAAR
jgi:hypothetical protein